jgi:hypothetical protein
MDELDADIDAMLGKVVRGETIAPPPKREQPRLARAARAARKGRAAEVERVEHTEPEAEKPCPYVDPKSLPWRFSRLKKMALSPAHYLHACQQDLDDSLALRLGTGTHAMLFEQSVVCYPHVRNGKRWEAFKAEHAEKVILSPSEWRRASKIVAAIRANRDAMRVLFDGTIREQRIVWKRGDRDCVSTPDARSKRWITDLKTTRCAEPETFKRDALRRFYHAQIAFYSDAAEYADDNRPEEGYIVAVESTEPFPVTVLQLTPELIARGASICAAWAERLQVCEATDHWPEYATDIVTFGIPDRELFDAMELGLDL